MKRFKNKIKSMSDKSIITSIVIIVAVFVLAYIGLDLYYDRTGTLRTEYINTVSEDNVIIANGFVFRDEWGKSGESSSVLTKDLKGIYAPVVSDGESVSKYGNIAYVFSNESQLAAYEECAEIQEKIDLLTKLQDSGNIGCLDVSMLNSEIASAVRDYVNAVDKNDFSGIDELTDKIDYKITSKQIATGYELSFTAEIEKLKKEKEKLQKQIGTSKTVNSPYAGYFVKNVDGFENLYDYDMISKEGITPAELSKLIEMEIKPDDKAFGKIILEHTWYYAFTMDFLESANLKVGSYVEVSFPQSGVSGLTMQISNIIREKESVAVVLKCVTMNDKLLSLRKEEAHIKTGVYTGCKISKEAITTVDNVMGVYVYSGNCAYFRPIEIVHDAYDYVIAKALLINEDKNNGGATNEKHTLKPYDKVILKGRNLYDGKVIG